MHEQQSLLLESDCCHRNLSRLGTELQLGNHFARILHLGIVFVETPNSELSSMHGQNETFGLQSVFGNVLVFLTFKRQLDFA